MKIDIVFHDGSESTFKDVINIKQTEKEFHISTDDDVYKLLDEEIHEIQIDY